MTNESALFLHNCQAVSLGEIPLVSPECFRETIVTKVSEGGRIVSLFGSPAGFDNKIRLYGIVTMPDSGGFLILTADVGESYSALTPDCVQAHWFEREIAEQWGVHPEGHPWLKPLRFHSSYCLPRDAWQRDPKDEIVPGVTEFFRVEGEEVHEVAVGPVHAGIIEPGHFRFQCHGENVMHLEISLGYQHRGIEQALMQGPRKRVPYYMETLAGDTTIGHTLAYCHGLESLTGTLPTFRAQEVRGIALELERLANHTGDLGALAGDVGYLPTASFCGRLRGDFLNMTAIVCGNRFGRSWVRAGGCMHDLTAEMCEQLQQRLEVTYRDTKTAIDLLWNTPSVMARFEETGKLTEDICISLGLVGVAARACGVRRDVRYEFPMGIYRFVNIPLVTWPSGDVFSRAQVRWWEIMNSVAFIQKRLTELSGGTILAEPAHELAPNMLTTSLVEGWRGEICHTIITDDSGQIARYKVVDPSFRNWTGLALALRGQQISDFPLCNKSFNLSYCGNDL